MRNVVNWNKALTPLLLIALVVLISACSGSSTPACTDDTWTCVQASILDSSGRCTDCHSGVSPMGSISFDADQYSAVIAATYSGDGTTEIVAEGSGGVGDHAASLLWNKVNGTQGSMGVRMPYDGPSAGYLTQADIDWIAAWIDAGAPQ